MNSFPTKRTSGLFTGVAEINWPNSQTPINPEHKTLLLQHAGVTRHEKKWTKIQGQLPTSISMKTKFGLDLVLLPLPSVDLFRCC